MSDSAFLRPLGVTQHSSPGRVSALSLPYVGTEEGAVRNYEQWLDGAPDLVQLPDAVRTIGRAGWALPVSTEKELFLIHVEHQRVIRRVALSDPLSCGAQPLASDRFICSDVASRLFAIDVKGVREDLGELPTPALSFESTDEHLLFALQDRLELRSPEDLSLRAMLLTNSPVVFVQQEVGRPSMLFLVLEDGRHGEVRIPRRKRWPTEPVELRLDKQSAPLPGPLISGCSSGNHWVVFARSGEYAIVRRRDQLHQETRSFGASLELAYDTFGVSAETGQVFDLHFAHLEGYETPEIETEISSLLRPPLAVHRWKEQLACRSVSRRVALVDVRTGSIEGESEFPGYVYDLVSDPEEEGWLCLVGRHLRAPEIAGEGLYSWVPPERLGEIQDAIDRYSIYDDISREEYRERGSRLQLYRCDPDLESDPTAVFDQQIDPNPLGVFFEAGAGAIWAWWEDRAQRYDLDGQPTHEFRSDRPIQNAGSVLGAFVALRRAPRGASDLWVVDLVADEWTVDLGESRPRRLMTDLPGRVLVHLEEEIVQVSFEERGIVSTPPLGPFVPSRIAVDPTTGELWTSGSYDSHDAKWIERLSSDLRPLGFATIPRHSTDEQFAFTAGGVVILCGAQAEVIEPCMLPEPGWLRVALFEEPTGRFPLEKAPLREAHQKVGLLLDKGKNLQFRGDGSGAQRVAAWERAFWQHATDPGGSSPLQRLGSRGKVPEPGTIEARCLEELADLWTSAPPEFAGYCRAFRRRWRETK